MNRPAHTVPSQLRHDAKTLTAYLAFNFTAYVTSTEANSGNIHCLPEGSLGTSHQRVCGI
jgi:hypothetical protein